MSISTPTRPTLYTYPECGYTDDMRRRLQREGVDFEEVDLDLHPERIPELLQYTGGDRITPVFVDGDTVQIGMNGIGCTF